MIGYNRIKNYIEDNEFHFDIFIESYLYCQL